MSARFANTSLGGWIQYIAGSWLVWDKFWEVRPRLSTCRITRRESVPTRCEDQNDLTFGLAIGAVVSFVSQGYGRIHARGSDHGSAASCERGGCHTESSRAENCGVIRFDVVQQARHQPGKARRS